MSTLVERVKRILGALESSEVFAKLECDGATRVVAHHLTKEGISFTSFKGYVYKGDEVIDPHFWIEFREDIQKPWYTIDYKLELWLEGEVPCGIFNQKDYELNYQWDEEVGFGLLPDIVYWALMS